MTESCQKIRVCKKDKTISTRESLEKLSREELIEKVIQLEAHNNQLKNILQKKNKSNDTADKVKKIDFDSIPKRHVLLKFYYLGWDYQGYVVQEDTTNTIEHFLFQALEKCCLIKNRESSNYHRCGRTDKGVSAFSQVISIDLRSKVENPNETNVDKEFNYCSMLNRVLPDNIRCYSWSHAAVNMSARFDCSGRTYKYYFPKGNLNIEAMVEGSKFLIGSHDFRNLCKMDVGNGVTEFKREICSVDIRQSGSNAEPTGYQMLEFVIQSKSFLWHQIRCIMSVLLLIGQEKESPDIIKQLLDVDQNLNKPQYSLASHLPLNLHRVEFENCAINWNTDVEDVAKTIKLLQTQWTNYSIRCTMIKDMIENLQQQNESLLHIQNQTECLHEGVKSKVYKPLLSRMKCESLENKINHYIKKRKLEVVERSDAMESSDQQD